MARQYHHLLFLLLFHSLFMSILSVPVLQEQAAQAIFDLPAPNYESSTSTSLPVPNSTHSFWINSPGANPLAKEGSEGELTVDADVCIIGSGITGVSVAYHLAKSLALLEDGQITAVVLEARDFCSGATGRNGGHLTPVPFLHFKEKEELFGSEDAKRAYLLEKYTASEILNIIKKEHWEDDIDLVSSDHVSLFVTDVEVDAAKLDFAAASKAGLDVTHVEWLSDEEVRSEYGATFPGVRFPGNNLWPLKLVTKLFKLTQKLDPTKFNLKLHTNTPVTSISPLSSSSPSSNPHRRRRWALTTPRGNVQCKYVVHATNAYASSLLPQFHGPNGIVPTRGQVMAMRADVPAVNITKTSWGGNQGFEYWFPRPVKNPEEDKPLVILGGGRDASGPNFESYVIDDSEVNGKVGKVLRDFLPGLFPRKYEIGREPEMEWTGIMGYTKIGDPFVGPVLPSKGSNTDNFEGQYISAGYTGHGMTRAFACAEAVAQMINAEMIGKSWTLPDWLPRHFLTTERR